MGKILCLHGHGCNASIFEAQLSAFRRLLDMDSHYEFYFLDAEEECDPAPSVDNIAPPPYLGFYNTASVLAIQHAHDQILQAAQDEGPFDGVIGYCQGAALAASMLLHQALKRPSEQPLFNFAIFFASSMPFSPDKELYSDFIDKLLPLNLVDGERGTHARFMAKDFSHLPITQEALNSVAGILQALEQSNHMLTDNMKNVMSSFNCDVQSDASCRPYHHDLIAERIWIPTLHVHGAQDTFNFQSQILYRLCSDRARTLIKHRGSHEVPRHESDLSVAVKAAAQVIKRGRFVANGLAAT